MVPKLHIKNGLIYDPINHIEGEVKDILIENGKVVGKFSNSADIQEIDASGKTVVPAALDIHAHIASQQLNWVRLLGSHNSEFFSYWKGLTLEHIARSYISNGYTFVLEANVYPSLSKHTIFDLSHIPELDTAFLLNLSNYWPLELEFQRGIVEDGAAFISYLLKEIKAFGIKAYNPFESENWNWKVVRDNLNEKGRLYNFAPMDVYVSLVKFIEDLELPHALHAHIEGYESEKAESNLRELLEKINGLNLTPKGERNEVFHLAHASSYNVSNNNSDIINFYNAHQNYDLDLGFIAFNVINPLVTSDRFLINSLTNEKNPYEIVRYATEFEGDFFATLRKFDKQNYKHCNIWANAYELALKIKNKWQLQFSMNYPNYADVLDVPEIASLLLSSKAREDYMKDLNEQFVKNHPIVSSDQNISFQDYIIITRASPAKSLGISHIKGSLTEGNDGDLNIIDLNPLEIDPEEDYMQIRNALSHIEYVIKAGKIVKRKNQFDITEKGHILWASGKVKKDDVKLLFKRKEEFFQKYNSLFLNSYSVSVNDKIFKKVD
jgi:formylmethanofuran dehydrogenase subunit A